MKSSFELRNFQIGSRDFEVRLQPTAQLKSSTFTLETHSTQLTLPLKHLNFISWTPSLPMLRKRRLMIAHSTKDSSTKYIIYNFQRLLCLLSYLRSLTCYFNNVLQLYSHCNFYDRIGRRGSRLTKISRKCSLPEESHLCFLLTVLPLNFIPVFKTLLFIFLCSGVSSKDAGGY